MAGTEPLAVWLYGEHVATLDRRRGALRLTHTATAQRRFGLNTPLVSVSMPVSTRPHPDKAATPFFEGLLPEGEVRRAVAYDLGLPEADTFALLYELGRDCAGALVIQPLSYGPPPAPRLGRAEPVDGREVERRLSRLRSAPLGIDDRVRLSLAGVQGKLLLVRRSDGGWALPLGGVPSTHILKPPSALPHMVENEALCLRLARHLGMAAAEAEIVTLGGRPVLVVTRFDRRRLASGEVERVHQEDVCQALSVPPARKYEESGGPSFAALARLLRRWRAHEEELDRLLEAVTLAAVIGNADLHGKNLTLTHSPEGEIRLAPLYDVMATRAYPGVSSVAGMFVNDVEEIDAIGPGDLVAEAGRWGVREDRARAVVDHVLEALPDALAAAAAETPEVPESIVSVVFGRARRMREAAVAVRAPVPGPGSRPADQAGSAAAVWVAPYRRLDGTPVAGHWRSRRTAEPVPSLTHAWVPLERPSARTPTTAAHLDHRPPSVAQP